MVENGGQGVQQQHLRGLQMILCLARKTCYALEEERGRMVHGRKFPGQGRRQCRRGGLLRREELGRVRETN